MSKQRKKKSISAIALIYIALAAVISAALILFSYFMIQYRTISRESRSLTYNFEKTCRFMETWQSATTEDMENDLCVSARLAASAINASEKTLQPSKYKKGWIIKRNDKEVEFPKDFSSDITLTNDDLPDNYSTEIVQDTVISCAWITGDYYYVEFQDASENEETIEKSINYQKALDNIASATGYDYINVKPAINGDYTITSATGKFTDYTRTSELGLNSFLDKVSADNSDDSTLSDTIRIKGRRYIVFGLKESGGGYESDYITLMLVPLYGILFRDISFTLLLVFLILIMSLPLAVWVISIFRRIIGGYFTEEQLEDYKFETVKRKTAIIICICTVMAFASAAFALSLDGVFLQTSRGNSTLKEFFARIDDDSERTELQWRSSQARYITNAKKLASLIEENQELQNAKWLEEASEIIDADYIMLFDENGEETVTNSKYRRISLKNRTNPDMADFSRLLNGVRSISHEGVTDEVTGLTCDYHGVCLESPSNKDAYGALLIAADPEKHDWVRFSNINNVAATMAPGNGFIIGVDAETGKVDVSSRADLQKSKLKKSDRDDAFLGFISFSRKPYFAVSSSHEDRLYYYGVEEKNIMSYTLLFALGYALLVMILLWMLSRILFSRSPYQYSEAEIVKAKTRDKLDRVSKFILNAAKKNDAVLRLSNDSLDLENTKTYYYKNVTPEHEAMSTFKILVLIFTTSIALIALVRNVLSQNGQTAIDYLFTGKWTHGVNLFAIAAILSLFCLLFASLAVLKVIAAVLDTVLSKKGRTICSLTMNILFYIGVTAFVLCALGYLGVNATAIIASAGFAGLAISMGFKNIVSDVLSGIMVIASGTYEVGDYVTINDSSTGTVKSMGLWKTELVSDSGHTYSIRNSQIKKVTNKSRTAEKNNSKK